jgi:diaminohydroxyphosphoribosylaminopyrimidine deaminase / 5-amino-6-(5-phosphoribosylamino)uracil reductase
MSRALDIKWMKVAIELAADIPHRPWPNPPVGAVVVLDGEIVGKGAHFGAGTDHAERIALNQAGSLAKGATLYCTLEPCNHHGLTPPCSERVIESGVSRCVIAMLDTNSTVAGGGLSAIKNAGVNTEVGVCAEEVLDQMWPFIATDCFQNCFVLLKTCETTDGFLSPGLTKREKAFFITCAETNLEVHRLRRWCDAVIVGKTTVEVDVPKLDGRNAGTDCPTEDPLPGYVDTNLTLSRQWREDEHLLFCGSDGEVPNGARAIVCDVVDNQVETSSLVKKALENKINVMMVEGGPHLAESFLKAGMVDRWIKITAPVELGKGVSWPNGTPTTQMKLTSKFTVGRDSWEIFDKISFSETLEKVTKGVPCSQD